MVSWLDLLIIGETLRLSLSSSYFSRCYAPRRIIVQIEYELRLALMREMLFVREVWLVGKECFLLWFLSPGGESECDPQLEGQLDIENTKRRRLITADV